MPGYVSVLAHTEAEAREVLQYCNNVQIRKNKNGMIQGNGRWVGPIGPGHPMYVPPAPAAPAVVQIVTVPETTAARAALSQAVETMLDHCYYVKKLLGDG
jgi:hypothetical protein